MALSPALAAEAKVLQTEVGLEQLWSGVVLVSRLLLSCHKEKHPDYMQRGPRGLLSLKTGIQRVMLMHIAATSP
ncbi:hypothetical protein NQZ68_011879 [Dissostichus eleginoides]|nr:hypothetical protein NQZ68_011879 [Dissostichus eleginoides]